MAKVDKKLIHTVLDAVAAAKTREEKIKILQENNSVSLRAILKGGFDVSLHLALPEGVPPYTPLDEKNERMYSLEKYRSSWPRFVKREDGINNVKNERQFIRILETIHPKDAELVLIMKDHKMKGLYKGLTSALVNKAFPGLIKEDQ
jgi:mRNA-degrading endonuclease YafQ of YafQ-DinJ toxin-antitoxin module